MQNTCYNPNKWRVELVIHSGNPATAAVYKITPASCVNDSEYIMESSDCAAFNGTIPCFMNKSKGGLAQLKKESINEVEEHAKSITKVIEVDFPQQSILLSQKYYVSAQIFCNNKPIMDQPFEFNHGYKMFVYNEEQKTYLITQNNTDRYFTIAASQDPTTLKYTIYSISLAANLSTVTIKGFYS